MNKRVAILALFMFPPMGVLDCSDPIPYGPLIARGAPGGIARALTTAAFDGIDPTGVKDSTAGMQRFFAQGGDLIVQPGIYLISEPLLLSSNTNLACQPGARFFAAAAWLGNGNGPLMENIHHNAKIIVDSNISITGCDANLTNHPDGTWHTFVFDQARQIRIDHVSCFDGGDCTSMQATNDTVVENSYANGITNACWDHWDAPRNATVQNNQCHTALYGVLMTGTNTTQTSTGQAAGGNISGNTIFIAGSSLGAGVWLNGLGAAGSGASGIEVTNNDIRADGAANYVCLYLTGMSAHDVFRENTCRGSGTGSVGFIAAKDSGGRPQDDLVAANVFDDMHVRRQDVAVVKLGGARIEFRGNFIIGGSYTSAIWVTGINNTLLDNNCESEADTVRSHGSANSSSSSSSKCSRAALEFGVIGASR